MKKIISLLMVLGLLGLVSCGSKDKKESANEVTPSVQTQPDYIIQEMSKNPAPKWIKAPQKADKSKVRRKYRYFVNSSEHASKRLCLRSAEARATAHVAGEIAQFIKNTYAEATQGGGDEEVSEYMQEQLAQETQAFVVGSRVLKTFWEKRFYKEELGAEEDKRVYSCFAVVRISKKNLAKAVRSAQAKLLDGIENPEVKQKTKKIIGDVANAFNKVRKPVQIEAEE